MPASSRITPQQALDLYRCSSLPELADRAQQNVEQRHHPKIRTYVIERNINYTNICQCRCRFCAFSVSPRDQKGYVLTCEQIAEKIESLLSLGGAQILLQGGLHPHLSLDWYERMLRDIRRRFPSLHIHAFSPPEIHFFAQHFDLPVSRIIRCFRDAGLNSIPGGGAEILVNRVRRLVSPAKCTADQWLEVMRQAHRLGLCTTATMMFGHVETLAERIEHLDRLRTLQDDSLRRRQTDPRSGYFTAFTCWPFQPGHTRLSRLDRYDPLRNPNRPRRDDELLPAGAFDQLKMTALARLYLDNVDNIQASWVTQGPDIAQLSLLAGANDAGSLMMEENVVAAAGTSYQIQLDELRRLIRAAGFQPVQRDYYYQRV